jgi:MoaA/NifB/PqqE/SkfB family radical SAM enzyme
MHSDLFGLARLLRASGIRVTVLTTGLLVKHHARRIAESVDDVIVSLDGPPEIHNQVRRITGAFARLQSGLAALREINPDFPVSARSTVQRMNYKYVRETARIAHDIGCRSISFLAVDMTSEAFNRTSALDVIGQCKLALEEDQILELQSEFAGLLSDWAGTSFLAEDKSKLERILQHFRVHLGLAEPVAPRCNAPWVSAVVESDGTVRPCFFQKPIGNLSQGSLLQVINGPAAVRYRSALDVSTDPVCKRCVCSLNLNECA